MSDYKYTNELKKDLEDLFIGRDGIGEEVHFRNKEDDGIQEILNDRSESKCICIISCEYDTTDFKNHLNYYSCYWGSKELNNILKKNKCYVEWFDSCLAGVYIDDSGYWKSLEND